MDPTRSVDAERLRRDIEATRASITGTMGELRRKVGESMQWQTYVERHPAPVLVGAAVAGLVVGRRLARMRGGNSHAAWTAPEIGPASPVLSSARFVTVKSDRLGAVTASWQRLGSRVEALANRVIDEVADAAERAIVPALVGGIEALLEGGRRSRRGAPAGPRNGGDPAPAGEGG
jgi:hypothetical protein